MNSSFDLSPIFEPYYPPETDLVERLRFWTLAKPEAEAFQFLVDGQPSPRLTYAELDRRARAIATRLLVNGLAGQRALLLFPPGLEFVEAFFGCLYARVVAVPAYPPRRNRNMGRINAISEDANAAVALSTRAVIDRVDGMLEDAPSLRQIPWLGVDEIPSELAGDFFPQEITPQQIALLQYTSGSTGSPKGVMLTHGNLVANCRMITHAFEMTRLDRTGVSWLPLYHDMGLVGGALVPLFIGGRGLLMSPISFLTRPIRWLRAISEYRAHISGGPNFAYALCAEKITPDECVGLDLSSWEIAYNGAEPVRADVLNRFTRKFAPFGFRHRAHYPCYGMAETTLLVTGSRRHVEPVVRRFSRADLAEGQVRPVAADDADGRDLVGAGRVVPGEDVAIVDRETGRRLPSGEIGEIWVNGPSVGEGYWNKPQESEETFRNRLAGAGADDPVYLRTGDLGFLDQGELFVTGRIKDMIIVRGVNRYPQDIEATVEQANHRLQAGGAAAFAVEHDRELLVVVCEVERDRSNTYWGDVLDDVRSAVAREHDLPPDAVVLVRANSIPKTSSGKVQRHACRQKYLDGKLLVVAQWNTWDSAWVHDESPLPAESNGQPLSEQEQRVAAIVIDQVRQVARERGKKIDLDTNVVVDLGLDSLERLNIAAGLERTFGGRIPDDVLQEVETIREIARAITTYIGSEPLPAAPPATAAPSATPAEPRPVPESNYELERLPEFARVQRMKELLHLTGIRNPFFSVHQGRIADTTRIGDRTLISFSSYNYLGLSGHPDVAATAKSAIDQFGTSASASRLVSGEKEIHQQFEGELAEFLNVEDVITFAGGHATNESVIGHVVGPGDLVIHDALAHNSVVQGAELSGARRRPFDHNDWRSLNDVLREIRHDYRRVLIVIEGLYSMDGDYPDLPRFVEVKDRHKCWLYIDEAHSIGTMGPRGRGLGEVFDVPRDAVEFWMGTLSKTFGSCGGFIAGKAKLIEYLRYTTPGFVYAAALPPPNVGAALGALRVLLREPERVARLHANAALFLGLAKAAGLDTGLSGHSPIIPIITGDSIRALKLSEALFHAGINAQPILHPAVEEKRARLRFFITSEHNPAQIRQTVETVAESLAAILAAQSEGPSSSADLMSSVTP